MRDQTSSPGVGGCGVTPDIPAAQHLKVLLSAQTVTGGTPAPDQRRVPVGKSGGTCSIKLTHVGVPLEAGMDHPARWGL
jgi:hypothetical protein